MAGSSSSEKMVPLDPEYIQFLLDPDLGFSCYFVVGSGAEHAPVEKIGVVKKMLAAHSSVFRAQLMNRQWKSKEPEEIVDIFPATFKNLLRYIYGWDTTATMSFEDADDLLYAADRYIMNKLKDKLVTRLMSLLDYTNVCSLLTNPACATALHLHAEITKILQYQTDKVLSTPQFLSCCTDTFVKILEQEVMNVTELEVWKAALAWAKKRANKEDAPSLRQHLEKPLQHIRVCSLTRDEFCDEVVPTGVLTNEEVGAVCNAVVTKRKQETLTTVCNNMQVRRVPENQAFEGCITSKELQVALGGNSFFLETGELSFSLQTHSLAIELTYLSCCTLGDVPFAVAVMIETAQVHVTTVTHTCNGLLSYVPISTEQKPVVLLADRKYNITLTFDGELRARQQERAVKTCQHFTLQFPQYGDGYISLVHSFRYKTLTPQ